MGINNNVYFDNENQQIICQGNWDVDNLQQLKSIFPRVMVLAINAAKKNNLKTINIDGSAIKKMDSAGAWLLLCTRNQLQERGVATELINFNEEHLTLLGIVDKRLEEEQKTNPPVEQLNVIAKLGKNVVRQFKDLQEYLAFVGKLTFEAIRVFSSPKHFRINSLSNIIYRNGYQALPIIALLSFMIGVVISYQMGLQLKNYGANAYIVDLLGWSILREFGPLLTAIMVAGRTGSAFTAQIGMMKLNQEIDALDTMGVTPGELLLLPRIVGLFIALPLLVIWADAFGIFGGMVMANNTLDISWNDFLARFPAVVPVKSLLIGLGKAPVFALIIASIGCFEGMEVEGSADSVGQNTTKSVVLSIFFIIVVDAAFSIIFSRLKI